MNNSIIKVQKSCRGIITWSNEKENNVVYTIDTLNDNNDDVIKHLFENTKINYKIQKQDYHFTHKTKTIDEFIKAEEKSEFYKGVNDNIKHYIKHFKYTGDTPEEIKVLRQNAKTVICPVTKETFVKKKDIKESPYFMDIINNGINNKISVYLNKIGGSKLQYIDDKFIILPDLFEYPINKKDIELFFQKDLISLFDFLTRLNFTLFIRDTKYKNVYDLTSELLEEVQKIIIQFYTSLLGGDYNKYIISYIVPDTKYDYIIIKFFLFDVYKGYRYISFIDYYKYILINEAINLLRSEQEIVYYKRFDINEKNNINCKDNLSYKLHHSYDLRKQMQIKPDQKKKPELEGIIHSNYATLKDVLTQGKNAKIEILNKQYQNVNTKGYCSLFLLVSVTIDSKETIYEVTLKTITYSTLRDNCLTCDNFKKQFYQKLTNIIQNNTESKIEYSNGYSSVEYYDYLPASLEIKIKPIEKPIIKARLYFLETATNYLEITLSKIKETKLDSQIILYMIYERHKDNEIGELMRKHLAETDDFVKKRILTKAILSSNNFLIREKAYFTNDEDTYFYVLWYYPKFEVIDKVAFEQLLITIKEACNKIMTTDNEIIRRKQEEQIDKLFREKFHTELSACTNYKEVYEGPEYIHNLKHLEKKHKTEIDELLNRFYIQEGYKGWSEKDIHMYPYLLFCNYPNEPSYNNFHMQIISFKSDDGIIRTKRAIQNYNYFDPGVTRGAPWELIKYYDYGKLDSILSYDIIYNKEMKEFQLGSFEDLMKKVGRDYQLLDVTKYPKNYDLQVLNKIISI